MNNLKKEIKDKIKLYSNKEYLDNYMKSEYISDNGEADIYLNINKIDDLFDNRTVGNQKDLNPDIFKYIEDKTSMLDNDIHINLHIVGIKLSKENEEIVKHDLNEHYAIELYKIQKEYVSCRNKFINLLLFGLIIFFLYFILYNNSNMDFIFEILTFLSSFAIWEAFESLIYDISDIKYEREEITQNLILSVVFED